MARPKSIEDEEILEAAREVFREEGIQGTTAEIARRAGISEGTIYRRWPTKTELFHAALDLPSPPAWVETLESVDEDDELFEAMYRISFEILEFFEEILPKLSMVTSSLGEEQLFESESSAPPVRALKPMTRFFERERKRGRVCRCDPEVVARMYLGSLLHFAFSEISGINDILPMPRETYVRGVVTTLLDGIGTADIEGSGIPPDADRPPEGSS
jgi:AcrR family transcriptional regulator